MIFKSAFSALGLVAMLATPALGHDFKVGELKIDHPWSRPSIANRPAAAYMVIENTGSGADRLVSASSPAFEAIELHLSSETNGVMKMEPVKTIDVPAGGTAMLEPGGYHVMLFGGAESFKEGDSFPLLLEFEKAGTVEVTVNVEKGGAAMDHSDHSGHGTTN